MTDTLLSSCRWDAISIPTSFQVFLRTRLFRSDRKTYRDENDKLGYC